MEIIDIFSEGIIVDDSVCEFIYSFSGRYPDKAFVDMAVRDESFESSEAALDLIFFLTRKQGAGLSLLYLLLLLLKMKGSLLRQ